MAKDKIQYVCSECGHRVSKWQGKCNKCHAWNSFEEIQVNRPGTKAVDTRRQLTPIKLTDVQSNDGSMRLRIGINEFDINVTMPKSKLDKNHKCLCFLFLELELIIDEARKYCPTV